MSRDRDCHALLHHLRRKNKINTYVYIYIYTYNIYIYTYIYIYQLPISDKGAIMLVHACLLFDVQ